MRIMLVLAVAAGALAGCQSEEQVKQRLRAQAVEQCTSQAAQRQMAPGLDVNRFCACLADRTIAGRSVEELENMNASAGEAVGREAGAACMAEQGGAAPAAGGENAGAIGENVAETEQEAAE